VNSKYNGYSLCEGVGYPALHCLLYLTTSSVHLDVVTKHLRQPRSGNICTLDVAN